MLDNFIHQYSNKSINLIIVLCAVMLVILAILPSNIIWITIKLIFTLAFLYLLYLYYLKRVNKKEKNIDEGEFLTLENKEQNWLKIEDDQDVEEQFEKFLDSSLKLIQKVLVSESIVLLFANYSKKEFTIRHKITEKEENFILQNTFDISKGLPSLVLRNRSPLVENHLPTGNEIIPYYQSNGNQSHSFAAIPIFYKNIIIGVLCADTSVEEAYSNEDLEILKHFGNLISVQLFDSNKLYQYESENWLTNTLFEVSQEMILVQSVENLWSYLCKKIPKVITCDRISISIKINQTQGKIICLSGGTGNLKEGKVFTLTDGIVGWVIRKNQSLLVEDFSLKENYVPRFSAEETQVNNYLSLISVPIADNSNVLAAICLESYRTKNFKDQHKRILHTIGNQAATVLIKNQTLDNLRSRNYKDDLTQLENLNAFKMILPKEIKKSTNLNIDLNLLFIKIYFQLKEDDPFIYNEFIQEFLSLTLPRVADTDYIFRLFPETFTIMCFNHSEEQTKELANKLLHIYSEKKIWVEGNVFDFYVNFGIVSKNWLSNQTEEIVRLGEESIKQARLKGPNTISVYHEMTDEYLSQSTSNES